MQNDREVLMKLKKLILHFVGGFFALSLPISALGVDLDSKTRDLLIVKFERVLSHLAPKAPAYTSIALRLADLLAERARQTSIKELAEGCTTCRSGLQDRQKALKIYENIVQKVSAEQQGKIFFQIGHLREILGDKPAAIKGYKDLIATSSSKTLVAETHAALGELFYKDRKYASAKPHFKKALKMGIEQVGLANYRLAWCDYNTGAIQLGTDRLINMLKNPKLLTRTGSSGVVSVDPQFQEEISRDLATFLAKQGPSDANIDILYQYSPESTKLSNLSYLANELERLGRHKRSIDVWLRAQALQPDPKLRLEGHVRLSQLFVNAGDIDSAMKEMERAVELWGSTDCTEISCSELKSRLRKLVLDWHRANKTTPSVAILDAYSTYLSRFSKDTEMRYWAAGLAKDLKLSKRSMDLFQDVALAQVKDISKSKAKNLLEDALLNQIEVAELSKDKGMLQVAYNRYLDQSLKKSRLLEVRYQKAKLIYDSENYEQAARELKNVALMTVTSQDVKGVRMQAADLALDALVLLKDDKKIELWAMEFAKIFPSKSAEYTQMSRRSVLNQTALLANTNALEAWNVLLRTDLSDAKDEEKIIYYKNKVLLAEKLKKFSEERNAVQALLNIKTLTPKDRRFALSRRSWLAELVLDFTEAYETTKKLKLEEMSVDKRILRLAMFAELAGKDYKKYYRDFLKFSGDSEQSVIVAARLVREVDNKQKALLKYKKNIIKNPELYMTIQLEVFIEDKNLKPIRDALKDSKLAKTAVGKILQREVYFTDLHVVKKKVAEHAIRSNSQKILASDLKKRIQLFEKLEKKTQEALESSDWMSQIVALSMTQTEAQRLYNDILALPIPDGLTSEEQNQYLSLLGQQAGPYQVKASDINIKVKELLSDPMIVRRLVGNFSNLSQAERTISQSHLKILRPFLPETQKVALVAALKADSSLNLEGKPSLDTIEQIRANVRKDPLNLKYLGELKNLEERMGNSTMVSYLTARISKMGEDKGRLNENL